MNSLCVSAVGKKKTAAAKCNAVRTGVFSLRVNNVPLQIIKDKLLVSHISEIISVIGRKAIEELSFDILTTHNGPTATVFAAKQAFARSIIAYYGKFHDEYQKIELMNKLLAFDKYCLVTDSRRREPKKFGGPGARARYQKSYR
ncbi:hypothetical protein EDEG_00204 [Edhazardia aedis USNM 41457]|uniref:40S ribosomal protein S16 n=1 Tax=Edhazardia aedis (strain USNM 41457) TaxID=1003232 RepID=J8ZUW5_EDHAE|nr:hypothetical protein EDEG_00204 [Edhazardia aedis USNM 41457]|eukprot:EJW03473.1 hypothetical protein EDEG_00204 [Edhazardia aedis USNM 41457]